MANKTNEGRRQRRPFLRRFLDGLYRWSGGLAALFLAGIAGLVLAQVTLNLIDRLSSLATGQAIGLTIPSYADFTGFFLAASSFFALAYTFREGGHIRVTLFIQHTSSKVQHLLDIWSVGLVSLITGYFTWYTAALTYESFVYNDLSPGMIAVPIWIPQAAMLAGLIMLMIALIDDFVTLLTGGVPSYSGKGENLLEGEDPIPGSGGS